MVLACDERLTRRSDTSRHVPLPIPISSGCRLANKSTAELLLRRPADTSLIFRPLPLESAYTVRGDAGQEHVGGGGEGGGREAGNEGGTGLHDEPEEVGRAQGGGQRVNTRQGAVVQGHRVLTRGGARSERIRVKFRAVRATAILLKVKNIYIHNVCVCVCVCVYTYT